VAQNVHRDSVAVEARGQLVVPTLVFPTGTCRVPILHPPAPKVLVWNVSRSKIAPCGCKVAAPGTRRE
jgi:hypothetical protein